MRKWIGRIFLASAVVSVLAGVFLAVYYNVIVENHEGAMDLWAILVLVVPIVICVVSRLIIDTNKIELQESFDEKGVIKKWLKIAERVFIFFAMVVISPILLIFALLETVRVFATQPRKKTFQKLVDKGYAYAYKNKKYTLRKGTTIVEIPHTLDAYSVSFDGGESFVQVEESELGSPYEREELKYRLHEYLSAHIVDKQRGDAPIPLVYYVEFLSKHLQ